MENTTYIDVDGSYETLPDMSQPYILRNGTIVEFDIFQIRKTHMALGAGGILSTANDMAKYMDFHLSQGRVGNRQIVPTDVMSWLHTVSNGFDFQGGRNEDADSIVYGALGAAHGLFSTLYDGWSVIHHSGYWPPYHCDMQMFPATRIGIFTCANGPGVIINYPTSVEHQFPKGYKTNRASTVLRHSQIRTDIVPEDVVGVYDDGIFYIEAEFVKNATLDTFPVIPWSPDSCEPE